MLNSTEYEISHAHKCQPLLYHHVSWIVRVYFQGLFWAYFIAVTGLYSQCQKESFFPNFGMEIPNFKSEKNSKKNHHFYHSKSWLKTVE